MSYSDSITRYIEELDSLTNLSFLTAHLPPFLPSLHGSREARLYPHTENPPLPCFLFVPFFSSLSLLFTSNGSRKTLAEASARDPEFPHLDQV